MLRGFKNFLMRGNVVDLAVAVVIGAAFAKVVGRLLQGLINPLIASVAGKPNLPHERNLFATHIVRGRTRPLCQMTIAERGGSLTS